MKIDIHQLEWHDSEIRSIYLDRLHPGEKDELILRVSYSDEQLYEIVFKDCYKIIFDFNMGVVSSENIFDVSFENQARKNEILKNLKPMNVKESELNYFKLETGSTGSFLEIFYINSSILCLSGKIALN